jgi:hypothetical protein
MVFFLAPHKHRRHLWPRLSLTCVATVEPLLDPSCHELCTAAVSLNSRAIPRLLAAHPSARAPALCPHRSTAPLLTATCLRFHHHRRRISPLQNDLDAPNLHRRVSSDAPRHLCRRKSVSPICREPRNQGRAQPAHYRPHPPGSRPPLCHDLTSTPLSPYLHHSDDIIPSSFKFSHRRRIMPRPLNPSRALSLDLK